MIPGFPMRSGAGLFVDLNTNAFGVNLFQRAGSPSYATTVLAVVRPGVTVGSTATDIPALDCSEFPAGTLVVLVNQGRIQGCGGEGGKGDLWGTGGGTQYWGGGGGGGAGTAPGTGGITDPAQPSASGASGDSTSGGTGANSLALSTGSAVFSDNEPGEDGGDAISHGAVDIAINNIAGEIWGGGGGGGGSQASGLDTAVGGDGGDPGRAGDGSTQVGNPVSPGGAAGYAVRGTGTVTFNGGGVSPNVEGTVGS